MVTSKYKLIRVGKMPIRHTNLPKKTARFYQLKALRDIPEHGVKAGDLGGYVTRRKTLSHEGSCWVGGKAQIIGKVSVEGNAYIGDNAVVNRYFSPQSYDLGQMVIRGNAKITEFAVIEKFRLSSNSEGWYTLIEGNAEISGNALLQNVNHIKDQVKIYGKSVLDQVFLVAGNSEIFDNANVGKYCKVRGNSKILGHVRLEDSAEVSNSVIGGYTEILPKQRVLDGKLSTSMIGATLEDINNASRRNLETPEQELPVSIPASLPNGNLQLLNDVEEKVASYETDIVKLIKYPAMVDKSIPETLALTVALSKAKRLSSSPESNEFKPESNEFKEAVESLEEKFFIAESHARKIAATTLSEEERKKTEKAKDLFRVAANDASSEQEKKVAFKQGFKQLEGVLDVPDIAVDTFRIKIGLREIEA